MMLKYRGLRSAWLFLLALTLAASSALAAGLPSSAITAPANNSALPASLGSYNITGTAVDNSGSGLKKVEVSFNGGSTWNTATGTTSWSYNWAPLPLGSYSITSRATDNLNGNESPAPGTHVVVDASAPTSTITGPASGSYLRGTSVTISGTASDTGGAGLQKVEVSTNGGSTWSVATGTTSWSYTWTLPADGGYNIKSRATDNVNNVETAGSGITVTVDKTAPVVSAGPDKTAGIAFTQTATATDATAMTYAWSKQSGPGTITFGSAAALSTTVTASASGSYTLRFTATDAAGNSAFSEMTLTWDASAPTSTITSPSSGAYLKGTSVSITGTAADNGSVQKVEVSTNGGSTWSVATGTTSWSYTWTLPADGGYTIKSRATDNVGNVETVGSGITVTVSNTLATVVLDKPSYFGPMDKATITVNDIDASLTAGPGNDSITVSFESSSDATGGTVTLAESASVEGSFSGTLGFEALKSFLDNGKVYVSKGDTVTVSYTDVTAPSGSPQVVTVSALWDGGRAMWLRDAADIINNTGTARSGLYDFCQSPHGNGTARVDTLYLGPADAVNFNSTFLRSFIADAHSHGLRVECLMGAPGWATSSGLAAAGAAIDAAISFNDAGNPDERFDGIHLDVDPSRLSNWQTQTASVWSDYMALLNYCKSKVGAYDSVGHDMTFAVDMPSWFDSAYPGVTSSDSVQDAADYVVMNSGSDSAQGISSAVQHELGYAQSTGKKALIGAETACGTYPNGATFCEEGYAVMDLRLSSVMQGFQSDKAFMGLAVDDYQTYEALSGQPNSPVTVIAAPANGSIISGTGYTITGLASSAVGVQKVEVSTDGGTGWRDATDTSGNGSWSSWNYAWTPLPAGSATVTARATDTMGNVESPGASAVVQVAAMKHLGISTSPAGGGSVTANPGSADGGYAPNTQVMLTAIPANGYSFTGWSGDASGAANPLTVTMDADKSVTANFVLNRYHLTTGVNDAAGGSVTPGGDYDSGSVVQISATANAGYVFTGWSGDATGSANPFSVTMSKDTNITANFARQGISLDYSLNGSSVTLIATMYYNGSPAARKKITFYEQAGTGGFVSKGTVSTNNSGVAVKTFTSTAGDHHAYAVSPASGGVPTIQSDTVAYTIGKVVLVSPANGSVVTSSTPTLSWQAYPGAALYHVDISTSSKFGSGTVSAAAAGTSIVSPMTLIHGKTYYWRVYADITTGTSVATASVLVQGKAFYRKASVAGTTLYSDTWKMAY